MKRHHLPLGELCWPKKSLGTIQKHTDCFGEAHFGLKSYGTLCTTNKRGQAGLIVLGGMELVLHSSFFQAFSSQCISNWYGTGSAIQSKGC